VGAGFFDEATIDKTAKSIGVERLYSAAPGQTAADLCEAAARRLMSGLGWDPASVGGLLFLCQTPDYRVPATAGILQDRLGLPRDCLTLDINLGCSAFVNAWVVAASLVESRACGRVLILIGDTLRRHVDPADRNVTFILSDAGSATAIERVPSPMPACAVVKSDGSGYEALIMRTGGERDLAWGGSPGNGPDVFTMDGSAVFSFAVKEVPVLLQEVADLYGRPMDEFALVLLHQANAYMLKYIAKRAKIPMAKVPVNIGRYGNTNGSTIPFLICDLADSALAVEQEVLMAGFGIGLSWAGAAMSLGALGFAETIVT
jgi:3-oxoacyl-[acyl-carrier-protein] synthase-3